MFPTSWLEVLMSMMITKKEQPSDNINTDTQNIFFKETLYPFFSFQIRLNHK